MRHYIRQRKKEKEKRSSGSSRGHWEQLPHFVDNSILKHYKIKNQYTYIAALLTIFELIILPSKRKDLKDLYQTLQNDHSNMWNSHLESLSLQTLFLWHLSHMCGNVFSLHYQQVNSLL